MADEPELLVVDEEAQVREQGGRRDGDGLKAVLVKVVEYDVPVVSAKEKEGMAMDLRDEAAAARGHALGL